MHCIVLRLPLFCRKVVKQIFSGSIFYQSVKQWTHLLSLFHRKLIDWLIPGGEIILEGFSKEQLGRGSGGPKNADMLWSLEELKEDFAELTISHASELEITLHEGAYHQGEASVIRMIARKL